MEAGAGEGVENLLKLKKRFFISFKRTEKTPYFLSFLENPLSHQYLITQINTTQGELPLV